MLQDFEHTSQDFEHTPQFFQKRKFYTLLVDYVVFVHIV